MLEIQILPPLLFRTDFPGYRGLQYVHDFLVFLSHFKFLQISETPLLPPWLAFVFPC
jgi:hypothetical protein